MAIGEAQPTAEAACQRSDVCTIMYTSGTTGDPKVHPQALIAKPCRPGRGNLHCYCPAAELELCAAVRRHLRWE